MDLARAQRLVDMMTHPGWKDAKSIMDEIRSEAIDTMCFKLDAGHLTLANQNLYRGIRNGIDQVYEELNTARTILTPQPKGGKEGGKT